MAQITVTQDGATVFVSNGDRVVIDIPDGGTVNIVAANSSVRNFRVDYGDNDTTANKVVIDTDSFERDDLQVLVVGYDPLDALQLLGADNVQIGTPNINQVAFLYGNGFSGIVKILDPQERDLFDDPAPIVICFANGTIIDTALGPRPVESLLVGDEIKTLDNGHQTVRWIGRRELSSEELLRHPHLRPIRFSAGTMGQNLPWTDLVVSPQHRIRLNDWRAELLFGHPDVLIPAKAFLSVPGVEILEDWSGAYFHLLFDRHELVWSNGLLTESLHPGEVALSALEAEDMEIIARKASRLPANQKTSRPAIRVAEAKALNFYAA